MPRPPYDAAKAKRLLSDWIAQRVPKAPLDAPITVPAACAYLTEQGLSTHKATLIKYKLNSLVRDGVRQQREDGGGSRARAERAAYDEQLQHLRQQLETAQARARELLAQIAIMRFNAREVGIKEAQLMKAIPTARAHRESTPKNAEKKATPGGRPSGTGRR